MWAVSYFEGVRRAVSYVWRRTPQRYHCCPLGVWQRGSAAVLPCVSVAVRQFGSAAVRAVWLCGSVAVWQCGSVAMWQRMPHNHRLCLYFQLRTAY